MRGFRTRIKYTLEKILARNIQMFGSKSFAITHKSDWMEAWFSYRIQLKSIFEKYNINLVIDVGANEGQFSEMLRSFYSGKIISFEPISSVFQKLEVAATADPLWYVYNFALGSHDSTQTINVSDKTVFSSLLKTNEYCVQTFGDISKGTKKEIVTIKRLDNFLEDFVPDLDGKNIFLKMDTQGYDNEVFKGAENHFRYIKAIQSEVSLIPIYEKMPHWTESISRYEQAGFRVFGLFPVSRDGGMVIEYDCLLVKK